MAGLTPPPAQHGRPKRSGRWVVCNQLEEGRDPGVVDGIRHCERCGPAVYLTPLYVAQGYQITHSWCHPPGTPLDIHPQMLPGLNTEATAQAYRALGEIRHGLAEQTNPRRWWRASSGGGEQAGLAADLSGCPAGVACVVGNAHARGEL